MSRIVPTVWVNTPWERGSKMLVHWPGSRMHEKLATVTGTSFSTNDGARLNAHVDGCVLGMRFDTATRPFLVRECDRMVGWSECVEAIKCDPRRKDRV